LAHLIIFVETLDMDINQFSGKPEKSSKLSEFLNKRTFKKTQLDIVYTDIVNWQRNDLLFISPLEKGEKWNKLTCIEYIWIKIVEQLRYYGFTMEEIKVYKKDLMEFMSTKSMLDGIHTKLDELKKIHPEAAAFFGEKSNGPLIMQMMNIQMTHLEGLILNMITSESATSLLFFKGTTEYSIISEPVTDEISKKDWLTDFNKYNQRHHLSISLDIITKGILVYDGNFTEIMLPISDQEYQILKVIRNYQSTITKLTVRFKNKEVNLIEINSEKTLPLESRLMDYIKKGDYQTIEIKTEDGRIVSCVNTKKIKL
jgi:hypothetical protein